jgi:hypothetical protein
MRRMVSAIVCLAALLITGASAQMLLVDLSGRYRCVNLCPGSPGQFAYITQSGTELSLVDDAGTSWRGYVERPGRIWVHRLDQSAMYSADGTMIQFERGTVWQRDLGEAAPAPRRRGAPPAVAAVGRTTTAYDGRWNVTVMTRVGPCDPQYNFGARIVGGTVVYAVGPASLQGQVGPDGVLSVSVSAGAGRADGEGRLFRGSGSGTWRGQGVLGSCVGTWEAVRTG